MIRYRIEVTGVVQGVGFRWFTSRAASRLGLIGFVRNQPDGSVMCEAEGLEAQLAAFLGELRRGPVGARVDDVRVLPIAAGGGDGFEVRR